MTRIHRFAIAALLASSGLSCSTESKDQGLLETSQDQGTVEIALGEHKAVFRKISPRAYEIDYPEFYLLETEVTNRMFREYLRATGTSKDDADVLKIVQKRDEPEIRTSPEGDISYTYRWSTGDTPYSVNDEKMIWREGDYPAGLDDYPVALVTLEDAQGFCDWLSKTNPDKGLFRLPTWNEWMIAAFGSSRAYPWGDEWDRSLAHMSYGYSWDDRPMRAEPVKARSQGKTPEGLYGMLGNVSEYIVEGDPTNEGYFNLNARWMGGGFHDGWASSRAEVEQLEPRKDYWGYSHSSDLREDHLGFRVLLDVKKDRSLIARPPLFRQGSNQWRTDRESPSSEE